MTGILYEEKIETQKKHHVMTEAEVGVMQLQLGLPMWLSGKESPCQGRRRGLDP